MSEAGGQKQEPQQPQALDQGVKELAETLRDAAAQLRAILDNINNPLAAVAAAGLAQQASQQPQATERGAQRSGVEAQGAEGPRTPAPDSGRATPEALGEAQLPPEAHALPELRRPAAPAAPARGPSKDFLRVLRLLGLFSDMNVLPPEFFDNVVKAMGSLGIISEGERDALLYLLNTVKMGVEKGLTPQEVMSLLAVIFEEAGVDSNDMIKDGLMKVLMSKLRRQEDSR